MKAANTSTARKPKIYRKRRLFTWIALVLVLALLVWQLSRLFAQTATLQFRVDDFVEYWSAGRLLLAGDNPYAAEKLYAVQTTVGWNEREALMMWNPPWIFPFVLPFAPFSYPVGRMVWLGAHYLVLLFCADWLWRFYGGPARQRWMAWAIATTFVPTIIVLKSGQIGPFILAGVVLFLYCAQRRRWGWAGAATLLIALKPQLIYLFWLALLLWIVDRRRWAVFLGGIAAGLAALAGALFHDPAVVEQYWQAATTASPLYMWATPTIGTFLRLLFGIEKGWLQFLPSAIGALWLLHYWRQKKQAWAWREQMPVLMLVSLVTTSYGWELDQVVLLPALLQAAVWLRRRGLHPTVAWASLVYLLINALAMAIHRMYMPNVLFVWMPPALLGLYLYVHARRPKEAQSTQEASSVGAEMVASQSSINL